MQVPVAIEIHPIIRFLSERPGSMEDEIARAVRMTRREVEARLLVWQQCGAVEFAPDAHGFRAGGYRLTSERTASVRLGGESDAAE